MFLRPLYYDPVTDTVTAESIIFITWAFYTTIKNKLFLFRQIILTLGRVFKLKLTIFSALIR